MLTKKRREDFWYAIPGAWMGASQPINGGVECYVVVDANKLADTFAFFSAHKRSVRITETRTSVREPGGIHITYSWLTDLAAAAAAEQEVPCTE